MPRKATRRTSTTSKKSKSKSPAISTAHKIGKEKEKSLDSTSVPQPQTETPENRKVENQSEKQKGERDEVQPKKEKQPEQGTDSNATPDNYSLEKGNIHFYYRPKVQKEEAHSLGEVQRLFVILSADQGQNRMLVVGKKKLPSVSKHEKFWGKFEKVTNELHDLTEALKKESYSTATLGDRVVEAARPAGYGRYAIVMHKGHSFLAFALEVPETLGEVQKAFQIPKEGSFVLKLKKDGDGMLKWVDVQQPAQEFQQDTEVLLIGASNDLSAELKKPGEEIKEEAQTEVHTLEANEDVNEDEEQLPHDVKLDDEKLFEALQLERQQTTITPLITGEWK